MQKNRIGLRKVSYFDNLEGLKVLQELVNEEGMNQEVAPKNINEELYKYWIEFIVKESFPIVEGSPQRRYRLACTTYWVTLDKKIIGLADIKHYLNQENSKVGGHIGIVLLKDYRNNGNGLRAMKLLVQKARNDFKIKDILITTQEDNYGMRKVCEKLGAVMTDIDEECHYWLKYSNNQ